MSDRRVVQLSAGRGPVEARTFVGLLAEALRPELEARGVQVQAAVRVGPAKAPASVQLIVAGSGRLDDLLGTHCWVHRSPHRGRFARKRWFASVQVFGLPAAASPLDPAAVRFETCRARGPGGQNVNRRETAVRAIHPPSGLTVRVESQRSQHQNRAQALAHLAAAVAAQDRAARASAARLQRAAHDRVERGGAVWSWRGDPLTPVR